MITVVCMLTGSNAVAQYKGGTNDGNVAVKAISQNVLPNIYKGGYNDGISMPVALSLNYQPNIYTGGDEDGTAQDLLGKQLAGKYRAEQL